MHSRSRGGYQTDAEEQDARGGAAPAGTTRRPVIAGEKLSRGVARARFANLREWKSGKSNLLMIIPRISYENCLRPVYPPLSRRRVQNLS